MRSRKVFSLDFRADAMRNGRMELPGNRISVAEQESTKVESACCKVEQRAVRCGIEMEFDFLRSEVFGDRAGVGDRAGGQKELENNHRHTERAWCRSAFSVAERRHSS